MARSFACTLQDGCHLPVELFPAVLLVGTLMLEKDVEGAVNDIKRLTEMGYSKIPRHIEEAALLFKAKTGLLPELNGLKISDNTKSRFAKYESSMMLLDRNNPAAGSGIQNELKNTYWYYLDVR